MQLTDYRILRSGMQANSLPAAAGELARLELELSEALEATGLFEAVEVGCSDDPERFVIAMCRYSDELPSAEVARLLEEIWERRLRYSFWEAHSALVERDQVELQGATLDGQNGFHATVHVIAQKVRIPAQRGSQSAQPVAQSGQPTAQPVAARS